MDTFNIYVYVEKRKLGKSIKCYLVHSYRDKAKVKKIRKYLGRDLSEEELETAKKIAEQSILRIIEELSTEVFLFTLTKNQIEALNKYDRKIGLIHLDKKDWLRFTEEFVYDTNAIEGSTVQRSEVPKILEEEHPKDPEELETQGVAKAVEFIRHTKEDLSLDIIKTLHKLCFEGSKDFAGEFRDVEVVIRTARGEIVHAGIRVSQLAYALSEIIAWYKTNKKQFKPLVLAAILHNQFEYIHPFQDGNGRVGRLLLNFILIKNNYPPINVFLSDRAEYYRTLQEYQKNGDLKPTLKFLIKQYKKTLKKTSKLRKKDTLDR